MPKQDLLPPTDSQCTFSVDDQHYWAVILDSSLSSSQPESP